MTFLNIIYRRNIKLTGTLQQVACRKIRFFSLFTTGDVSRGGTSATQWRKFHTDDVNHTIESSKNIEITMGQIIYLFFHFDTYFGNSRLDVPFSKFIFVSYESSWGPGGVFQISSDMDDWMEEKIKTQKNPWSFKQTPKNFWAIKFSEELRSRNTWGSYTGTITNLQIALNTQQNPYLNQATQETTCQTFPTRKNPLIIPVTWNLECSRPPLGAGGHAYSGTQG